jgi:hypothetical protein
MSAFPGSASLTASIQRMRAGRAPSVAAPASEPTFPISASLIASACLIASVQRMLADRPWPDTVAAAYEAGTIPTRPAHVPAKLTMPSRVRVAPAAVLARSQGIAGSSSHARRVGRDARQP